VHFKQGAVSIWDAARLVLFLTWWPGLYVMYSHMVVQRRKVLGKKSFKMQ